MLTLFAYGVSLGQSSLDSDLSATLRRPRRVKFEDATPSQSQRRDGSSMSSTRLR